MGRIFSIIAALSALMVVLAGGGSYWYASAAALNAQRAAVSTVANGLAISIAMQLDSLQKSVDGLAQSEDVISALQSGDPALIQATAAKLQGVIPHALRLRLLLPNISEPDQSLLPHMGFGDLEMVRATLSSKQQPVLQGEGEHRHLALTSLVTSNQQALGVVLVSLKPDLAQQIIAKTSFNDGYIELKQDQLVLAKLGQTTSNDDPQSIPLANSRWQINFWPLLETSLGEIGLVSAIIAIPALLACLAFFAGYRKLTADLHHDQSSILKAAKDMMTGKNVGNYPIQLDEMRPIISTLAQFKRVIAQEGSAVKDNNDDLGLFDESFDLDFLEASPSIGSQQAVSGPVSLTATPIAMPSYDDLNLDIAPPAPVVAATAEPLAPAQFVSHQTAPPATIFRGSDIRGIVGKDLDATLVKQIGLAFASEVCEQGAKTTIVVARDGRLSSPELAEALIKGIISTGCDVLDIGVVPTPVLYFVVQHSEGRTGVMVTGGQNPAHHNGLKLLSQGETLTEARLQALRQRIEAGQFHEAAPGSVEQNSLFSNEYIGMIAEDIHIVRPMTVVVDCGNGATGKLGPMLLKSIGCDVIELFSDIDGLFPNHQPDPSNPANLQALSKAVKLNNADVGIAFDGDGSGLGIVDSSGKIIAPDRQMILFARDVLTSKPGAEIIFDVKSSRHLPEQIAKRGGRGLMWKSSHALLKAKIQETGAALAGELSGHFFFNDRWFGFDDALYAAVRMIELLSADTRISHEVFADVPDSINTPELQVPLAEGESQRFIEQAFSLAHFPNGNIINIDGMRVEFPDGWGLICASNNLPGLVLRFEADNHEALSRIQSEFKLLIAQIKPDLSLPF